MSKYEAITLTSGATVNVCLMDYETWESLEDFKTEQFEEAIAAKENGQEQRSNFIFLCMHKELRRRKLAATVENSEAVLATMTAFDVRELDVRIDNMNFAPVSIENLFDAGSGPATLDA